MNENVRVRFAPSPTGQVHIGNIRVAIFNWLFARSKNGSFLLRIEDTDLERSTPEAIKKLLECMQWLNLDYDEEPVYQTSLHGAHIAAAEKLLELKHAYKLPGESKAVVFRIPYALGNKDFIRDREIVKTSLFAGEKTTIGDSGLIFFSVSKKGKALENNACLAGFKNLKLFNAADKCIFELEKNLDAVSNGQTFEFTDATSMSFLRREVFFNDLIKGEMAKPLDSMKNLVIVRSDGSEVFHLANVCDDAEQKITHIIRGDDHVENTFRHIMLFDALGLECPLYAHLPMIVNQAGKPYSKRDGDAFVGDFRDKGFLAAALFNYLSLLGWSPGDDREKMATGELIESFSLERVKSSAAQFDMNKLQNLNAQYIAELPFDRFLELSGEFAHDWQTNREYFAKVAQLMQSRCKNLGQIDSWRYFFDEDFAIDEKSCRKQFKKEQICQGLKSLAEKFTGIGIFDDENILAALRDSEKENSLDEGKLNQALRLAITGVRGGADILATLKLIGRDRCVKRLKNVLEAQNT